MVALGKRFCTVMFGQVVISCESLGRLVAALRPGVAPGSWRRTFAQHALAPHLPGYAPPVVICAALANVGIACFDWPSVQHQIQNHCLPPMPAVDHQALPAPPAAAGGGEGSQAESDRPDNSGSDESDDEGDLGPKLRRMRVNRNYWRTKAKRLEAERDALLNKLQQKEAAGKTGPAQRYFSLRGGLNIGLQANLCCLPSATLGFALQTDVSRKTVTKWEVRFDDAIRASCFAFHRHMEEALKSSGGFLIHAMRSDATNAKIWQRRKMHQFESDCFYCPNTHEDAVLAPSFDPSHQELRYLGDLQIITDCTGNGCHAMLCKQAKSVGMTLWTDAVLHDRAQRAAIDQDATLYDILLDQRGLDPRTIRIYLQNTDAGPDQVRARKLISAQIGDCLHILHLDMNCLMHQGHLAFKSNLRVSEWAMTFLKSKLLFHSSLAKCCNLWREYGREIYAAWVLMYGAEDGQRYALNPPGRCLVGRWGAVHECQKYMVAPPPKHVKKVVCAVLSAKTSTTKRRREQEQEDQAREQLDLATEEREAYVEKLSRWARESLEAMEDKVWWTVLRVSCRARSYLDHFLHWLKKHGRRPSDMQMTSVQALAKLCWYKAKEFAASFDSQLNAAYWADVLTGEEDDEQTIEECMGMQNIAVVHLLNAASEYDVRVLRPLNRFPAKMMLLAVTAPGQACETRKRISKEMLDADVATMELNTLKIRILFEEELRSASQNGLLDPSLFAVMWWVCRKWMADTQAVEGLNNALKAMITRAPQISQQLISARLSLRQTMGMIGIRGVKLPKYSQVKPLAESLLDAAEKNFDAVGEVLGQEHRWAPSAPGLQSTVACNVLPSEICAEIRSGPSFKWACVGSVKLIWHVLEPMLKKSSKSLGEATMKCFCFEPLKEGVEAWVPCTSVHRLVYLVRCVGVSARKIEIVLPMDFQSSVDLMLAKRPSDGAPDHDVLVYDVSWKLIAHTAEATVSGKKAVGKLMREWPQTEPKPRKRARKKSNESNTGGCDPSDASQAPTSTTSNDGMQGDGMEEGGGIEALEAELRNALDNCVEPTEDGADVDGIEDVLLTPTEWQRLRAQVKRPDFDRAMLQRQSSGTHDDDDEDIDVVEAALCLSLDEPEPAESADENPLLMTARMWQEELDASLAAVPQYDATGAMGGANGYNLSLVEHVRPGPDGTVVKMCSFVHWTRPDAFYGQIVTERLGFFVSLVPLHNPHTHLEGVSAIIADIGERGDRRRSRDIRVAVPKHALRLKQMWQTSLSATDEASLCSHCLGNTSEPNIGKCCICLQTWHPTCADEILESLPTRPGSITPHRVFLPPQLARPCPLCRWACQLEEA